MSWNKQLTWIYYLLDKTCLSQIDYPNEISLTFNEIINGFVQPTFLCLHGSKGAPLGCINPRDASYWKMVEEEGIIPENGEPCSEDVYTYSRTRWYAFTLNGMRLISQLLFALTPGRAEVVLCIRNRFGLIDLIYDVHEEFDTAWEPPERFKWSTRAKELLGDRVMITKYGYELWVSEAHTIAELGVVYEISPFEAEYTMWDVTSDVPILLWRGFGIRDDYCDLCLCFENGNSEWMLDRLHEFCKRKQIQLLYCPDWSPKIEFDEKNNEVFPPPKCSEINLK